MANFRRSAMLLFSNILLVSLIILYSVIPTVFTESLLSESCQILGNFYDCSSRKLSKVPNDLPPWADILKLNRNSLTEIPYFSSVSNLSALHLGHNQITSISRNSLDSVLNLKTLELNDNHIKEIRANDFPSASKLQFLNLNHNDITQIESGCCNGLKNLLDLKLSRNKVAEIVKDNFKELTSLTSLELSKNQLKSIPGLTFQGLNSLTSLKLRQNSIRDLDDGALFGLHKLHELHLDFNDLTTISGGWLYGLGVLSLLNVSNNRIHSLPNDWSLCPQLRELEISNNELELIMRDSFKHLNNLVVLNMNNNRISYIEEGAFRGLPALQILDLSNNLISWIAENTSGAFSPLKHLQKLYLSGNKILHISKNAFAGLSNVTFLDLSNNAIASIEDKTFSSLPSLYELHINSSSMICDCALNWFSRWLNETSKVIVQTDGLSCVYPATLKKKPVVLVPTKDFICSGNDHPQPRITVHPEDTTALVGHNVTLRCGANSSTDSDMSFTWMMNNRRLENVVIKRLESAQNHGITQFSDVFLSSVTMENAGIYQCMVTNSYGVAYSENAQLSVLVFPTIVKAPSNVMAKVGGAAKLECSATGSPAPQISWHKDGGSDFPAARSKRMKIMNISPDEPFFIVEVRLEDAGTYTCSAQNLAGSVNATATLTVLEAPSLTKSMKNKEVLYGGTVVLECRAVGSPKPKVSWTKNGKPLVLNKRHVMAAEDQLLVITESILDDAGIYECYLTNDLGTQRGRSELKVLTDSRLLTGSAFNSEMTNEEMIGIIITTTVLSVVITSAVWVFFIHWSRNSRRRMIRKPMSPVNCKSENSSHSSKDSGTGDSTKRSYQDLLLTNTVNHGSIMGSHSESPSPVPESTLPLLTTFHPLAVDNSPYVKDTLCSKSKYNYMSSLTPIHYQKQQPQQQQQQLEHNSSLFCGSPASSSGIQCACLTATFKKTNDVCERVVNHCGAVSGDYDVSCYGDIGKRPCSIPVQYHTAHPVPASCCKHHPNSYLCLYVPPAQHNVSQ